MNKTFFFIFVLQLLCRLYLHGLRRCAHCPYCRSASILGHGADRVYEGKGNAKTHTIYFLFCAPFRLALCGEVFVQFHIIFCRLDSFFCLCSFIFVLNQLKSHYYEKILIIALVAFYAVAVGFSAVYEVRASQSFVGSGGFDGPDPPGFDILTMPCPNCGVSGKLVKTNYDNKPGEYYTCLNCMFLFQVIRD